jgi:hypothetical protein
LALPPLSLALRVELRVQEHQLSVVAPRLRRLARLDPHPHRSYTRTVTNHLF